MVASSDAPVPVFVTSSNTICLASKSPDTDANSLLFIDHLLLGVGAYCMYQTSPQYNKNSN